MADKIYKDPHLARRLCAVDPVPTHEDDNDIIEYAWKQKVKKVGDGPDDFVVYEEVEEVSRVPRKEYIAKDASDVGVLNILKKVQRSGDVTLLNQTGAVIPEGLQDYTNVPGSVGEALNALKQGDNSFAGLKAIFGDVTFNELGAMSEADINAAYAAYIAKLNSAGKEKTNEQ